MLQDMVASTFWSNFYRRNQDIARVTTTLIPGRDASLFCLEVSLKQATNPQASLKSVLTEMKSGMANRTYGGNTLEIYKRGLAVDQTFEEEDAVSRALELAESAHHHRDPLFLRGRGQRTLDLRSSELAAYWRKYLDPD